MITKTNAVKMSVMKWETKARGEHKPHCECGFCEFFEDDHENFKYPNKKCQTCPLYPDVCMNNDEDDTSLYHKYWNEFDPVKRIELAKEILDAIKERGAKWIKGG